MRAPQPKTQQVERERVLRWGLSIASSAVASISRHVVGGGTAWQLFGPPRSMPSADLVRFG